MGNNNIIYFVVVGEITDSRGSSITHLLIGLLAEDQTSGPYLICYKELDKTNNFTITRFLYDDLSFFFLKSILSEKVLLMVYDTEYTTYNK